MHNRIQHSLRLHRQGPLQLRASLRRSIQLHGRVSPFRFRPCRESPLLFGSPSAAGVGYDCSYNGLLLNLKTVSDLHRRGCTRTAFEFAKLLYSLDPWTDPHGSLLHLDGLALKAGMHEWLLDVWECFEAYRENLEGRLTPTVLPGWWYTRALAIKVREDTMKSQASEISYHFTGSLTPFGAVGSYVEHPGVRDRSVAFPFTSPITRGQGRYTTI